MYENSLNVKTKESAISIFGFIDDNRAKLGPQKVPK